MNQKSLPFTGHKLPAVILPLLILSMLRQRTSHETPTWWCPRDSCSKRAHNSDTVTFYWSNTPLKPPNLIHMKEIWEPIQIWTWQISTTPRGSKLTIIGLFEVHFQPIGFVLLRRNYKTNLLHFIVAWYVNHLTTSRKTSKILSSASWPTQ